MRREKQERNRVNISCLPTFLLLFLAKIASDYQKPDGLTLVPEATKRQFLRPLPVRVLPGVGRVTEQLLHRAGIRTLADLQDDSRDLVALLGPAALKLKAFSLGEDDRAVEPQREQKSFHSERTFAQDTQCTATIFAQDRPRAITRAAGMKLSSHTTRREVDPSDMDDGPEVPAR